MTCLVFLVWIKFAFSLAHKPVSNRYSFNCRKEADEIPVQLAVVVQCAVMLFSKLMGIQVSNEDEYIGSQKIRREINFMLPIVIISMLLSILWTPHANRTATQKCYFWRKPLDKSALTKAFLTSGLYDSCLLVIFQAIVKRSCYMPSC